MEFMNANDKLKYDRLIIEEQELRNENQRLQNELIRQSLKPSIALDHYLHGNARFGGNGVIDCAKIT